MTTTKLTCIQTIRTLANELRLNPDNYVDLINERLHDVKGIKSECIMRVRGGDDDYVKLMEEITESGLDNHMCRCRNFHESGKEPERVEYEHSESFVYRHGYVPEHVTELLSSIDDIGRSDMSETVVGRIRDAILDMTSEPSSMIDLNDIADTVMHGDISTEEFRDVMLHETVLKPIDPDYHVVIAEYDRPVPDNRAAMVGRLYDFGHDLGLFPVDELSRTWRNYNIRRMYHRLVDQGVDSLIVPSLMEVCMTHSIYEQTLDSILDNLYASGLFTEPTVEPPVSTDPITGKQCLFAGTHNDIPPSYRTVAWM